jgi:ABC-type multidrug transport system ATPase subunit
MSEIILKTSNLTKSYKKRKAVDSLNLEVYRGDVFGFLGPNGAGKSTTIRMLFSLIFPDEGEIEIFGKSLKHDRKKALMEVGGVVEKSDFYLYLTGYKNLELLNSMSGRKDKKRIMEVLEMVGLKERAFDKVKTYSHGMKQRLGIAQSLVSNPKLVILDEPTNGLDPQGMKEIRDLINTLSSSENITVFISSHLLHEIEQIATRMAIINQGKLIAQGYVKDLLNAEQGKYYFKVNDKEKAVQLLLNKYSAIDISAANDGIECIIRNEIVPEINKYFVENNLEVSAIIPKLSLEEYFLSVTDNNKN